MSAHPSVGPLIDRLLSHFDDREEGITVLTDLIVLVAAADAVIDDTEAAALAESLETMLHSHVAPLLVRVVVGDSRARIRNTGVDLSADIIGRKLAAQNVVEDGIHLAAFIAAVSEGISKVERARIERIAIAAGVEPDRLEQLLASPLDF